MWFLEGDEINAEYLKPDEPRLLTMREVVDYSPDASFVPGNMIPSFVPGLAVAVFHGFDAGKRNRRGQDDHYNIRGCFDLYCTQGPQTTLRFNELAKQYRYFRVAETGWPTLDPLFDVEDAAANDKPTILMCSTFSRNLTCAPDLYEEVEKLSRQGKWRWLVQFHPKMATEIVDKYKALSNENLQFIETDDVLPLLKQADVMLCDTSSVLLMFLLQQKPVVTYKNAVPGPHLIDFSDPAELEQRLEEALQRPSQLMAAIELFTQNIHPYRDGQSSDRVLDAVEIELARSKKTSCKKPLNLVRNLKARKKLNYWKFW